MFDPVDPKQRLPELEEGILQYWREEDVFKRSVSQRSRGTGDKWDGPSAGNGERFSFYDGPPFATGLPHYGHLLAGTIKDVIPRYQTMRGKEVQRRFGWDCHGLPVENLVEKENDIQGKDQIEEMGVAAFNALCRSSVQRYTKEWRQVVERMGRWVDMDWDYRTMDPEYMESIWWVFKSLHEKKLIYEGKKSMHVCPRCVTPLSNFEVTQGYKDVTDMSATARFELTEPIKILENIKSELGLTNEKIFILAWTTTPWTLPGNLFLAVHPKETYYLFRYTDKKNPDLDGLYISASNFLGSLLSKIDNISHTTEEGGDFYQNERSDYDVRKITSFKGTEILGTHYDPLFPYFAEEYKKQGAFRVVEGDFVTTEDGTGIVHIAPGFGTDDYEVGRREGVDILSHVTMAGTFVPAVKDFAGMDVKPFDDPTKTDRKIAAYLKEHGKLFAETPFRHSYPHCWRCDHPLINYATSSWFVAVETIKEKMLGANAQTSWVPSHIRDGRFGKWLEGARDWAISRNRYWGTPLPIWRCEETGDLTVLGSRDDLMAQQKLRFTKVTALRHAESEGNTIPIYQGEVPGTDLTKRGKEQAAAAATFLKNQNVSVIYCSPLARAQQTAAALAKQTGAEVIVDDRLREVNFGDYESKTVDFGDLTFIKERRAHKIEKNKPESIYHFEGMETWESVRDRVASFLQEILLRHRSEHIVIVTHADPLVNMKHFFTNEDSVKLSHQPYPKLAEPVAYFWDHDRNAQMDLHKDTVDTVTWAGSPSKSSVKLTLVRHGETDWNKEGKIQGGNIDEPLNEKGKEQAQKLAAKLKKQSFDSIIASDLQRAVATAEILSKELNVPIIAKWPELRERNTGAWSGQRGEDIVRDYPLRSNDMNTIAFHHNTPSNGESLSAFLERTATARDRLLKEFAGKRILLVSHSGTTRALLAHCENRPLLEVASKVIANAEAITLSINPPLTRIPDVLDCWFESGSMPCAQDHYPFEMRHGVAGSGQVSGRFKSSANSRSPLPPGFPANFIAEGIDQTRGWFYTLMVLSSALFGKPAFENCVVNGIVLAEDGKKMSKRLKNYPEPLEVVHRHGADAVRFTLMSSPAVRGEDLRFSEKLVEETVRSVLLPLWNTYSFFVTYANAAKYEHAETRRHSGHPLDCWIRAEVQDLVNRMTAQLDRYDLSATCAELHDTIDALTNWYVRLSRRRFAGKGVLDAYPDTSGDAEGEDREAALHTLYDVLLTFSQVLAPFCPYITDAIYLNLVPEDHGSIHLTDWPAVRELSKEERRLMEKTRILRHIVSLGHAVRGEQKINARQPLQKATIALPPAQAASIQFTQEDLALLRQELNVKELAFAEDPGTLAEAYVQIDARKVGPRLGGLVQEVIKAGKAGEFSVKEDGTILILDEALSPDEATVVYRGREGEGVASDHGMVVSMETSMSDELHLEGDARDLIRTVQRLRKEAGLSFTDRIVLQVEGADDILELFRELVLQETRAELGNPSTESQQAEIGERTMTIRFAKR